VVLSAALSACDVVARPRTREASAVDWRGWWREQRKAGVLDFANWPYYIDRARVNRHPSLELFTEETGISVNYYHTIMGNARFLEKHIRPAVQAGLPTGWDLIVITNGPQLSQLINSEWLIPLDHSYLGNFRRYASDLVKDPPWDPGNRYTVAWQSGLTGIAFRPEAVDAIGHEPRSVQDLLNPALRGRVGMLDDLMDLGSVGLLLIGVDPQTSEPSEWRAAAEALTEQRDAGLVRGYYDQRYLWKLQRGETWVTQAWSGDIFQANQLGHPELKFVVPEEGAMLWTDNMMIPLRARHPVDAMIYMDFVYRPRVAAMIADWVWYITPVPASRPIIAHVFGDEDVARSPLVFPRSKDLLGERVTVLIREPSGSFQERAFFVGSRLKRYHVFTDPQEEHEWNRIFGSVIQP